MSEASDVARFYDRLAADYHLLYADWDASMSRQGEALDRIIGAALGQGDDRGPFSVLDCSCGIGTQSIALGLHGHCLTGTDISPSAAARAVREAALRDVPLRSAAADMRQLPFADGRFDVVLSADNSLPHLLSAPDVRAALGEMRRVVRDGGLLVLSTRPYDEIRRTRPASTLPQLAPAPGGRAVTFQLWEWHDDGEHYDLEHFQLISDGADWRVEVRRTSYWALTRQQLTGFVTEAGFTEPEWTEPERSGFFQPALTARAL